MQVNLRAWHTSQVRLSYSKSPEEWMSMKFARWVVGFNVKPGAWQVSHVNGLSILLWQTKQSDIRGK